MQSVGVAAVVGVNFLSGGYMFADVKGGLGMSQFVSLDLQPLTFALVLFMTSQRTWMKRW